MGLLEWAYANLLGNFVADAIWAALAWIVLHRKVIKLLRAHRAEMRLHRAQMADQHTQMVNLHRDMLHLHRRTQEKRP